MCDDSAGVMFWGDDGLDRIMSASVSGLGRRSTVKSDEDVGALYCGFALADRQNIYFTDWLNPYICIFMSPASAVCDNQLHGESKKCATLTMAITLSILGGICKNSFTAAKSSKFPTKPILGYPPHLKCVAALPWKT